VFSDLTILKKFVAPNHDASNFYPSRRIRYCKVKLFLSGEIRYYQGKHKVKVVTQSKGYWIVEALEDFEDFVDGEKTMVKTGEQRITPPSLLLKEKTPPRC